MQWDEYKKKYIATAEKEDFPDELIQKNLQYAHNLFVQQLPIIYDVNHFSQLVGIKHDYIYKITNSQKSGYRRFYIPKKTKGKRTINEPLPNLKIIQSWILVEILNHIETSMFAKAYKKNVSLKDNVKFHRGQKVVFKLDIENFFDNLKENKVLNLFLKLGYSKELSILFAKLCTLRKGLPQGAPTSASLSNILMKNFDNDISDFCKTHKIRYTRYADDLTFSGDFEVSKLFHKVDKLLLKNGLKINKSKTNIMRQHKRQIVTGIVVNQKIKVPKKYRASIRQEVYYIKKFGLKEHIKRFNKDIDTAYYIKSLKGRINYCLFIDPKDIEMKQYIDYINNNEFIL